MNPSTKYTVTAAACHTACVPAWSVGRATSAGRAARRRLQPPREVIEPAAICEQQRRFHVVRAQAVLEDERREREQQQHGRAATDDAAKRSAEQEHVDERDRAEQRVPERAGRTRRAAAGRRQWARPPSRTSAEAFRETESHPECCAAAASRRSRGCDRRHRNRSLRRCAYRSCRGRGRAARRMR